MNKLVLTPRPVYALKGRTATGIPMVKTNINRPSDAVFFEFGTWGPEAKALLEAFRAWEQAKRNLNAAHASMRFIENEGEQVKGSHAWRSAGTWTTAEYTRWRDASALYYEALRTPHLQEDFGEVLAYIRSTLRPDAVRRVKGSRRRKAA